MKKAFAWTWIMIGLIIGTVVMLIFTTLVSHVFLERARGDANREFSNIHYSMTSLCDASVGEANSFTVNLPDIVEAIYVCNYTNEFPDDIEEKIKSKNTSMGNYICMKLKNEKIKCKKVNCEVEMTYIGKKETVLSRVDKILHKGNYIKYFMDFSKQDYGVLVIAQ